MTIKNFLEQFYNQNKRVKIMIVFPGGKSVKYTFRKLTKDKEVADFEMAEDNTFTEVRYKGDLVDRISIHKLK